MGRFVDQGPSLVAGIAKQGRRLILPKAVLKEIDFKDIIRRMAPSMVAIKVMAQAK